MGETPTWLIAAADGSEPHRAWCRRALEAYFAESEPGRPAYTGAYFELIGENPPDRIVGDDLLAISLLGLPVPGDAVLRCLGPDAAAISRLLVRIPVDVDLHDAPLDLVDHGSVAEELWTLLRPMDGSPQTGPSRTSKLLARKRPRLLPIFDSVVEKQLGLDGCWHHWTHMHAVLHSDHRYVELLRHAHHDARLPRRVSLLRTLDVLLWMSGKGEPPPR